MIQNDPIGKAVVDYFNNKTTHKLIVHSLDFDDDEIPVGHLFRTNKNMPLIEKKAIELCRGKVLDVGACAGSHALELQKRGFDVKALELSADCCGVMRKRGVQKVVEEDIFSYSGKKFDTLLLLMNGAGLAGKLNKLGVLLQKLKTLLEPGGQVLVDSSDLKYLFEEDDGSFLIDLNSGYYGERDFQMEYNGLKSDWFSWLYIDPDLFGMIAAQNGFEFEMVMAGSHYDYLSRLWIKEV